MTKFVCTYFTGLDFFDILRYTFTGKPIPE